MKNFTLILFLTLSSMFAAFGQKSKPQAKPADKPPGRISGTVSDEAGLPIEDATISASSIGSQKSGESFGETTDRDGRFSFENLKPRRYKVYVRYAGYVLPEEFDTVNENQKTYTVNRQLNFIVRKGGAITGKIADGNGQPIVNLRVHAVRVRDEFGQRITAQEFAIYSPQNFTDDRGIYRIFGLTAGNYLIYVGGADSYSEQNLVTKDSSPAYYPSDSIDTAEEIRVGFGQETAAIDINFRRIQGFRITGIIRGANPNASNDGGVTISLFNIANGVRIVQTQTAERDGKYIFKVEQIPDGEYEIRAFQFGERGIFSKNSFQKIKIKGADVSGLVVDLKPLGSIKGNVFVEKNSNLTDVEKCAKNVETSLTSMIIKFDSSAEEKSVLSSLESIEQNDSSAPEENGEFEINCLEGGRYFLKASIFNEDLYVKEIFQPISAKEKRDLSGGLSLGTSENLNNVKIIISGGAAKIKGKIIVSEREKAEKTVAQSIVYLIPADEADKNNVLRYARSTGSAGKTFSFENIAPGNYFLLVENYPTEKDEVQQSPISKFWNVKERLKLFQAAKNTEDVLKVKPCQNLTIERKNTK